MTQAIPLQQYPEINLTPAQFHTDKPMLARQIASCFSEFGFFYLNDFFDLKTHLDDALLNTLPGAENVFYGEDAYTHEGSVFHGTYAPFKPGDDPRLEKYFTIFTMLRSLISLSLAEPENFLEDISRQQDYRLYIYQYEQAYLDSLADMGEEEIAVPPHVDKSLITIVVSIKNLEGYAPTQDTWVSVPDRPGYLIVHGGTLLQEVTQGRINAEVHRVRAADSAKAIFWGLLPPVRPE